MMNYGTMDYLVVRENASATFALAKELGFAGVEVDLTREQLREKNAPSLTDLKDASSQTGLVIPSLVLGHHYHGNIGSEDADVVAAACEDIKQAIDWAAELGAKIILLPLFSVVSPEDCARTAEVFRTLCPLAQTRGVCLCYEGNLPFARIRALAEAIDSPAFGCYFDLANVVGAGLDTPTEIRGIGNLIRQVHMKESDELRPGQGRINYAGSVAALREIDYEGWVILETPSGSPAQVVEDFAFTKRFFEVNQNP
jgi:sugar phosphate isomerase/epimerase